MMYSMTLFGDVQAKQRTYYNSKTKRPFTPARTVNFEATVRLSAQKELKEKNGKPFENACRVFIEIYKAVPSGFSKKKTAEALMGEYKVLTRPDVDNCAKSIMDALNGVWYKDDKLVTELHIFKTYGETSYFKVACEEL